MDEKHNVRYTTYILVWAALMILTAVTVKVSYINLGLMNAAVAFVIASIKASLVALYFMHLKQSSKLVWGFALFPLLFLVLIIAGTLMDTMFR